MERIPICVETRSKGCISDYYKPRMNGKQMTFTITQNHLNSGYEVDKRQHMLSYLHQPKLTLLRFADASAINRFWPELCKQKDLVAHLKLS